MSISLNAEKFGARLALLYSSWKVREALKPRRRAFGGVGGEGRNMFRTRRDFKIPLLSAPILQRYVDVRISCGRRVGHSY